MANLLYKIINPPMKRLLKSPLHGLMSSNTLLIEFTGRKSGRALSTPISYCIADGRAHCFTVQSSVWWRNLVDGKPVHLTIKRKRIEARPVVDADDQANIAAALREFLIAVPRDAKFAGVKLDANGIPDQTDIVTVAEKSVYLSFSI